MAENILAKLSLALVADIGAYKQAMSDAKAATASATDAMNKSIERMTQTEKKQFELAGKEADLLNRKYQEMKTQLEKTAASGASETQKINASLRLVKLESQALAAQWKIDQAKIQAASQSTGKTIQATSGLVKSFGVALAGAIGATSLKGTLELASQFNVLNQRIKTATKESGDYLRVSEQLYKVANQNGVALRDTVQLFQNIARTKTELGVTNKQIIELTDTIQKLGVIGGSSGEEMSNALRQFSQSMAGGVVRAEEFNSIVENMPELAHRIAVGLGVTDGELRKVMLSGKLMSKDVLAALIKQSGDIAREFDKMPKSMDQAYQTLANRAGLMVAEIDKITGATKTAVTFMDRLGEAFDQTRSGFASPVKIGQQNTTMGQFIGAGLQHGIASAGNFLQDVRDNFDFTMTPEKRKIMHNMREARALADAQNFMNVPISEPTASGTRLASSSGDPKLAKKHEADVQRANDLLASMRAQNAELEAKLRHDDAAVTKEKALLALSKDRTLTDKEKTFYAAEINKLAAQHATLIKQEAIEKEREKLASILAGHKEKIQLLKNELSDQTEENALLQASKQIQDAVKVGKKETAAAQQEILKAAKEEAILKDAVKLKGIEDSLKRQLEDQRAQNNHAKELIPILNAEKQIRDAITAGMDQNVAQQQRIRDLAKQMSDDIFAKQMDEEKKKLDAIGGSLADENEKLRLKLTGQENLLKYLDSERALRKQIAQYEQDEAAAIAEIQKTDGLTDDQKTDAINKKKKAYDDLIGTAKQKIDQTKADAEENTRLNQALTDQDRILENIKNGTGKYKDKLAELDRQYMSGAITQKQWQKTADELWKAQAKNNTTLGDGIKQIGQSFSNAIANGQKLGDVVKTLGKQLAVLAAQKLLFEPIANWIDNTSNRLMGRGKYAPQPTMPGSGGGIGQLASNSTSPLFGAGGQALGAPGVLSSSGGGGISNPFSGALYGWKNGSAGFNSLANSLGVTPSPFASKYIAPFAGALGGAIGGAQNGLMGLANLLGLPKFADGGVSRGGMALVGERGPELAYLPSGTQIYPNSNYNFSINKTYDGFSGDLAQVMDQVARAEAQAWLNDPANADKKESLYGLKMAENANGMNNRSGLGALDVFAAGGRVGWAAGDQHRAMLQKAINLGVAVPDRLMQYAGFEDDRWSSTGMSAGMFSALGYNSMGMGGGTYGGNSSATAYAAGRNEGFDYSQWGRKVGQNYIGPSAEYLQNIKGWGEFAENYPGGMGSFNQKSGWYEGPDGAFRRRYIGPGANSTMAPFDPALNGPGGSTGGITYGDGYIASAGSGGGKFRPDGKGGYSWSKNFDPLNPASGYTPELGTLDAFKASNGQGYKPSSDGPMYIDPNRDPSTFTDAERRYLADDAAAADRIGERIELDYLNKKLGYKNQKSPSLSRRDLWHYQQQLQIEQLGSNSIAAGLTSWAPDMRASTLTTSNTRNDVFEGNYSAPVSASWTQKGVAPFYKPATDGFTAGQIAAQMGIKGYANGGSITGGELALVGERGPELFRPRSGGSIATAETTRKILAEPPSIHIYNETGVKFERPRVEVNADGSYSAIISAVAANAAEGGPVYRGSKVGNRRPDR